ncbi:MAG: PHP domain-containing protein [Methanophagales archaeon ANME-1-THS]|nr:MAG: PHP domain-containing protein [Methanophagales archaeon ANME-1-THS]
MSMRLTLDLHVHTNYSHDGRDPVEEIIQSATAKRLDGIAICDHDTMAGSYAARRHVADHNLDLIIIPGIEVTTAQGHLIVLGLDEEITKGLSLEETIRRAQQEEQEKERAIVLIAPHPFHPFRHSMGNFCLQPGINAIEVFNSRYLVGMANSRARRTAARHNRTPVAGSDAHSAAFVGLATVEVPVESAHRSGAEVIVQRIKEGKVRITRCERTPLWVYCAQMSRRSAREKPL